MVSIGDHILQGHSKQRKRDTHRIGDSGMSSNTYVGSTARIHTRGSDSFQQSMNSTPSMITDKFARNSSMRPWRGMESGRRENVVVNYNIHSLSSIHLFDLLLTFFSRFQVRWTTNRLIGTLIRSWAQNTSTISSSSLINISDRPFHFDFPCDVAVLDGSSCDRIQKQIRFSVR